MMSFLEARSFPARYNASRQNRALRSFTRALCCSLPFFCCTATFSQGVPGTVPASAASQAGNQTENKTGSSEITAQDQPATFKVNVKLVVVRVVVRDAQGRVIGTLHKEDFQVFDKGKPQVVTQFDVEHPGDLAAKARQSSDEKSDSAEPAAAAVATAIPERFTTYIFDDVHLQFGDLARVREAAQRHFATLRPTDRAAIFTTSGQGNLDFTDDRTQLHAALLRLIPRPIMTPTSDCPDISYYQADLIFNKNDPEATQVAMQEALSCPGVVNAPSAPTSTAGVVNTTPQLSAAYSSNANVAATGLVTMKTQEALQVGDQESHVSLTVLQEVVRSISRMPGQRNVVLLSPGFITPQMEFQYNDIIDRALRSQVVINTLDARGLYTIDTLGDIGNPPQVSPPPQKGLLMIAAANANDDLLSVLADGTGGVFFHNSNDLDEGFRRMAQAAEYSYVLAFTPQNLKLDGSFHTLKVTLKGRQKFIVQARRGYFAPKHAADPNEEAKQEIEEAMYSQDELHNLPVKLHTQFFKASENDAKLIVLAHVDVQHMHYRKADGRNSDVLTCVSAVFNRNGNFVQGLQKTVTMHWKDETLEHKLSSGITLKSSFDVKPGSYLVRLVVRDSEGQLMSAENGTVEIR
jgi:VWFA-related protein